MGRGRATAIACIALAATLAPAALAAPGNDAFASGQAIVGASGSINGSNSGASKESGEPNHAGNVGGASVWYTWTAPFAGSTTITTSGSKFDTLLGVYTGSSVSALTLVASNDDASSSNTTSSVTFQAVSGTTYRIAVDGYKFSKGGASQGAVTVNWSLSGSPPPTTGPPNDMFVSAQAIADASGSVSGTNAGATKETGEPNHAGGVGGASIWYSWQAPASGNVTMDTAGSNFDTELAVYTGSSVSALTQIAANEDVSSTVWTSKVTFTATAGVTYRIAIDGYRHRSNNVVEMGTSVLEWTGPQAPPPPTQNDPLLLAAGDVAGCDGSGDAATAQILGQYPGVPIAVLGDLAYENGTAAEFTNCYAPSWGQFLSRTHPAPGNHEYYTSGAAGYYGYFGAAAGDPAKGYYSYDVGSWHVVVLNSNCAYVPCAAGSAQEQWLKSDLAAHPTTCTLAYWHHPLYTSGWVGGLFGVTPFWNDLLAAGADLVLNGHAHLYERFAPQDANGNTSSTGIREFVVGTGGEALSSLGLPPPNREVLNNATLGVLKLTLHAASYDWQFLPIPGQSFGDSGSGNCH